LTNDNFVNNQGVIETLRSELMTALKHILQERTVEDEWMGAKKAAKYLDMSASTFDKYRYDDDYRIPGYRVGGKILYKRKELDMWVQLWEIKKDE
jgi:Helix-turn-helix domain